MGQTASIEPQYPYSTATPLITLLAVLILESHRAGTVQLISNPLWALSVLQYLNACKGHLNFYSPYRPIGPYIYSVPVEYSYNSTPPYGP